MGTLIARVLCAWTVFGGLLIATQGAVYSTTDSSVRFSQCLIGKISRSPFFNLKDQSSLADVTNAMISAMADNSRGTKGPLTRKALAVAFVSSVADTIVLEDSEQNVLRKEVYRTALNQCSLSSVGYIDFPFIDEAVRIMTTLEMNKKSVYDDSEEALEDTLLDPSVFAPSPVQRSYVPEYSPNSKISDNSGHSASGRTSAGSPNPPSVYSSRMHNSETAYANARPPEVGSESGTSGVVQIGVYPESTSTSAERYEKHLSLQPPLESDVTGFPQSKEIKTIPTTPDTRSIFSANAPFQDILMLKTEEMPRQADFVPFTTQTFNNIPLSSPIPVQDGDFPIDMPEPDSFSLESLIADILTNSTSFMNAFGSERDEKEALNKALVITQQSLSGYDSHIVTQALNAVAAAVATVKVISPQSYALAISAALATVLRLHDVPLFAEGASFASSMLSNLDSSEESFEQPPDEQKDSVPDYSQYSWQPPAAPPLDFQSPALVPEDIQGEIFSETLGQYLRQSSAMTDLFCGNASSDVTTYFTLIKSAMSEYGMQVSSIAASSISGALADLPPDSLCSSFSRTISDTIAEILYENELLDSADPEELSKRFDFSASTSTTVQSKYDEQKTTPITVFSFPESFENDHPNLQPSFEENYSESSFTASDKTPDVYLSSSTTDAKTGDYSGIRKQDSIQEAKQEASDDKSNPKYVSANYRTVPMTTPVSTMISDEELTTTITFIESLSNDPTMITTESVPTKYPPVNQKELATLLLGEIEYVLDALNDRSDEQTEYTTNPGRALEDITVTPEVSLDSEVKTSNAPSATTKEFPGGKSVGGHDRRGRKRKRRKSTTPQPTTRSMSTEHRHSSDTEYSSSSERSYQQQTPPEIRPSNRPVVLYPSFQGPFSPDQSPSASRMSAESFDSTQSDDRSFIFAKAVSQIASSTISYIRSTPNLDVVELCARLNELAVIVGIPPVGRCTEVPLIDYLLNVLKAVTKILKGV